MADLGAEQQWIRDSRAGDEAAFAALVQQHQQMIHALTYRMTGSMADAEDLAQDAFVRAYRQLDRFRGDSKFSTWLCRIAVNACLNWRRREGRRDEVHERWANEALPPERSHSDESGESEHSEKVQAALNRLPAKQRAAIVLTVYQEMNHADAARVLGCTEATISWRVFAARKKLRSWLKAEVDP